MPYEGPIKPEIIPFVEIERTGQKEENEREILYNNVEAEGELVV
jgi:hypothetical protein